MIVGLVGTKGSGKTTAARYLRDSKNFIVLSFASPIKTMLWMLLDQQEVDQKTINEMLNGKLKEVPTEYFQGKTPRHAMQTLGTEWGRELIGPNFWVDNWERQAKTYNNVVVDDVRFQTEVDRVRSLGGICIRINRIGGESDIHSSEAGIHALTNCKYTVENDRGYVDLYEQLRLIMDIEAHKGQGATTTQG